MSQSATRFGLQGFRRHLAAGALAFAFASQGGEALADVPRTMTVQGVLRDAAGVPVTAPTSFRFELLNGSTSVWLETRTITPRAGLFTATLGTDTPLDPTLFANSLALRVTVAGEAMDPIPLTSVPYAFRADTADNFDGDVNWGQLTGVPSGFADGTDDGNTYAAGRGLSLTGETFAVDRSVVQNRVSASCPAGQSIRAIDEDGNVTCETDDVGAAGTTYTAGTGLLLAGATFAVDASMVQTRVVGACMAGAAIRAINSDGTVVCDADDVGVYGAGTGLVLVGSTFSVDPSAVQTRILGTCPAGSSIRAIATDGTVSCETDDAGSTYTAGSGLTLAGTTFSVNTAVVQARVGGTCPAGESIRSINPDGTVVCDAGGSGGVTFTRWGRADCPTGTSLVYTGFAAGASYTHGGSGSNTLCLTASPTWDNFNDTNQNGGLIYGTEYEMAGYGLASVSPFNTLNDQNAPCAVCLDEGAQAEVMIPGTQACPAGWNSRVQGYLMSTHFTQAKSEAVCVDRNATAIAGGGADQNGNLWYPMEAECGSLPCGAGRYVQDREVTCSVCTR